ncbi:MAG TPA: dienelactone hydrolase family protein [Edaphobacter sp.]|uniref:dienelactone hydrolase family protein n=1 Tax=Edaphobacter sp. TaxID=1934404 RepID=UPI002BFA20D5|nr:dienelactone hydrolase family protein [Edaphobacter sp.]HUZ94800.1 dienelactone hydrolase family protein [Edaphobacter sp.]
MTEQDLTIPMPDGTADAVLFSPEASTPLPGVLHLPDIGGIREAHRSMARRLSHEGYTVLLVNPFYRTSRPPVFDFPRVSGEPRTMQRMAELTGPLTPEAQEKDVAGYVDFLEAQPAFRPGQVGVVGYCFSGAMALRAAAVRSSLVGAAASFHGGGLYKAGNPASPHLVLPQVDARLYFGHAEDDKSMDAAAIKEFEQALVEWGGRYESETYAGAHHGWTVPDSLAFNPEQGDRAFEKLTELLSETLR